MFRTSLSLEEVIEVRFSGPPTFISDGTYCTAIKCLVLPRYENSSIVGIFIPFLHTVGEGFCLFKVITCFLQTYVQSYLLGKSVDTGCFFCWWVWETSAKSSAKSRSSSVVNSVLLMPLG